MVDPSSFNPLGCFSGNYEIFVDVPDHFDAGVVYQYPNEEEKFVKGGVGFTCNCDAEPIDYYLILADTSIRCGDNRENIFKNPPTITMPCVVGGKPNSILSGVALTGYSEAYSGTPSNFGIGYGLAIYTKCGFFYTEPDNGFTVLNTRWGLSESDPFCLLADVQSYKQKALDTYGVANGYQIYSCTTGGYDQSVIWKNNPQNIQTIYLGTYQPSSTTPNTSNVFTIYDAGNQVLFQRNSNKCPSASVRKAGCYYTGKPYPLIENSDGSSFKFKGNAKSIINLNYGVLSLPPGGEDNDIPYVRISLTRYDYGPSGNNPAIVPQGETPVDLIHSPPGCKLYPKVTTRPLPDYGVQPVDTFCCSQDGVVYYVDAQGHCVDASTGNITQNCKTESNEDNTPRFANGRDEWTYMLSAAQQLFFQTAKNELAEATGGVSALLLRLFGL